MSIPDFTGVDLGEPLAAAVADWQRALAESTGKGADALTWETRKASASNRCTPPKTSTASTS